MAIYDVNGIEITGGAGSGFTDDIKNALTICLQNVAWKNGNGDTYLGALVSAMNSEPLEYTTVCENYSPNSASFSFGPFFLDFENGDYIEALIDCTNFTVAGGMLFSAGLNISTWGGWNWHIPAQPTNTTQNYDMSISAFAGSESARDAAYPKCGEDLRLLKITKDNIFLNNEPVYSTGTNHKALVAHITSSTGVYIGSTQGNARSNALYKYVRIYRGSGE